MATIIEEYKKEILDKVSKKRQDEKIRLDVVSLTQERLKNALIAKALLLFPHQVRPYIGFKFNGMFYKLSVESPDKPITCWADVTISIPDALPIYKTVRFDSEGGVEFYERNQKEVPWAVSYYRYDGDNLVVNDAKTVDFDYFADAVAYAIETQVMVKEFEAAKTELKSAAIKIERIVKYFSSVQS